jgi:hypothetical protein
VGDTGASESTLLTESLLLDSLNLDDNSILDDHADFTVADALNGCPNVIQIQIAGGRGWDGSSIIKSGKSLLRHIHLATVPCSHNGLATTYSNRYPHD